MDTYCWIHSTFTIPDRVNAAVGSVVPHPGVATPDQDNPEDKHYHKYYQWVCFTLFFQALCFYIPRYRQSVDTLGSENSIIFQVSLENVGGWKTKHVGAR